MSQFVHLHVHSHYSILDGASSIDKLIARAKELGMPGLALTDHGNMFGIKEFIAKIGKANASINAEIKQIKSEIEKLKGENTQKVDNQLALSDLEKKLKETESKLFKPIVGCETYIAKKSRFDKTDKEDRQNFHLILLAKNKEGYHNLMRLVSYGFTEGFYYKPRIDKELLRKYSKGIIASSACLGGEIPQAIMKGDMDEAERLIYEYKDIFGDDFYLELMLHKSGEPRIDYEVYENQVKVNQAIVELSKKTGVKCIATNDVHFALADDASAHDILICLNTGKKLSETNRMRYTFQEYLKSEDEMRELFPDCPEAISNTMEIYNKVEFYDISNKPIMPYFPIPENFENDDEYLRYLTYEGAKQRWGENLSEKVIERLDFELGVIKRMGYPSYFLIVWDFIKAARELGVSVGPGRGSAAGSAVAYCLRITDIDPIKYDLLFERFLNPERISMPDIDIDFDEDGREEVLQYVVNKYGAKRVAHIITFGTMAAKSSIKDVARTLELDLPTSERLAKMVPERPGITLQKAFKEVPELEKEKESDNPLIRETLKQAQVLEGTVRQTGVHACGIIIGRNDLEEYVPLCTNSDAKLFVTQYEGAHVEDIGLLKMDFLGLKTLSIIKDTLKLIEQSTGEKVDINNIPLDDPKTFELFSRGDTTAIFQFESPGMKKYMRALQPNRFEDLIAMNALYRPGPMEYIPSFINRKHGREPINYDIPEMEDVLKDTYGITVYQEQVMLLSQKLAGFTKGQADALRKAMGKKLKKVMDELKEKFIEGCLNKGYDKKIVEKIWSDWEAFAEYAFNKSHSTCYAYVAYQTAYLKAHYPSHFMAAVLSRNLSDIKKITTFMDECRRVGIQVLGPNVNESQIKFAVMPNGDIRFGLGAIKGMGENAAQNIIDVRTKGGKFKNIFDFFERVNLQTVNKKNLEVLAIAGAFDDLIDFDRSLFFAPDSKGSTYLEILMRYGIKIQDEKNSSQQSLFGEMAGFEIPKPVPPKAEPWPAIEKLNKEKEVIGIYLSAHPLDQFKFEIKNLCNVTLAELKANMGNYKDRDIVIGGMTIASYIGTTKNGKQYGKITLEDYTDSMDIMLFGKDFETFRNFCYNDYFLLIRGKVQERKYRQDELEFSIKTINQLFDVREKMIKSITINLPIEEINDILVEDLLKHSSHEKASITLKFKIFDSENHVHLNMFSRSLRVNITQEFIDFLDENEFSYKVALA
ncbi:MAG: polymerase subunit alpha [Tenuifilum sp.]|jgi:DNA polymerase-3 subunit alpha|uniref:DNA polymerase III subunit alpha n=1 Tax=Tenuifilum sp. TaxID=2760880 RepID=UPI0024AAD268|nr:DNA polymerase III subunit alpha [Tenuifilum sp.]MDI3528092.1 polymerase subunit alpha [Tenuifilum sp.]